MFRVLQNLLVLLAFASVPAFAVDQGKLGDEIAARRARVPEFTFIAKEAKKLGVRAWLFGGTAAGYAHYVKWDLARESGDERYQKDRFDYDYTNIYRSTQDLDIVVDGPADKAASLEKLLKEKFPHFQGGKSAWEVRLLHEPRGDKEALLDNPNYLNQHTDSNSTGMIELTEPAKREPIVRDLLDWKAKDPNFLKDVREGKLHYYYSPLHDTTNRAKQGLNPPIESAVRYLTKAFQYELDLRPADLKKIRRVIDEFDPETVSMPVKNWLEKNGKKIFQHAVNLEYARETIDELGLAEKLARVSGSSSPDTLGWWMRKEPLRSKPVGQGKGATAAELFRQRKLPIGPDGALIVSHETGDFLAYESITRAHTGDPNVLISRRGTAGEAAAYGEGFYTKVGREGARGSGLTVRFALDPAAREGTDFLAPPEVPDYFVLLNKKAIRVIPESLAWSPLDYFRYLAGGSQGSHSDRALVEKLKRKLDRSVALTSPAEYDEVSKLVTESQRRVHNPVLLHEWLSHPASLTRSDELFRVMTEERPMLNAFVDELETIDQWRKTEASRLTSAARRAFKYEYSQSRYEQIRRAIRRKDERYLTLAAGFLDLYPQLLEDPAVSKYLDLAALGEDETRKIIFKLSQRPPVRRIEPRAAEALAEKLLLDERLSGFVGARYLLVESMPIETQKKLLTKLMKNPEIPNAPSWVANLAGNWADQTGEHFLSDVLKRLKPVYSRPEFADSFRSLGALAIRADHGTLKDFVDKFFAPGLPALTDDQASMLLARYYTTNSSIGKKAGFDNLRAWMTEHGGPGSFPKTMESLVAGSGREDFFRVVAQLLPQTEGELKTSLFSKALARMQNGFAQAHFDEPASRAMLATLKEGLAGKDKFWKTARKTTVALLHPNVRAEASSLPRGKSCGDGFAEVAL